MQHKRDSFCQEYSISSGKSNFWKTRRKLDMDFFHADLDI